MVTNNNNISITSFNKGMNTDVSYSNIQEGQYLYGENIRVSSYNGDKKTDATNSYGEIRAIEGFKNIDKVTFVLSSTFTFNVNKILSACSTRNIGIIVAEDEHKNWAVIRIKQNSAENDIEYCKLIFCSKDLNLTTPTELKNQLSGDKVSTVLTWETEDNIKLYIADGEHFMKIINVAEADDEINANNFGNVQLYDQFPNVVIKPFIFCGLVYGSLKAGTVQYAYRFYKKRGNVSPLSAPTKPIYLGYGYTDDDIISKKSKGGLEKDTINCGVSLRIPLESDQSLFDHVYIYRIFYKQNGQEPEISLIYDRSIIESSEEDDAGEVTKFMQYADTGQEALQIIPLSEFNNLSGVYVIPKTIEAKDNILFAANIKDNQSELDDIAKEFDARAFRVDNKNHVTFRKSYGIDVDKEYSEFMLEREAMSTEQRLEYDKCDFFNDYNDVTRQFGIAENLCKYKAFKKNEGKKDFHVYGGSGKYISWQFIVTSVIGDYSRSYPKQIGSRVSGIEIKYPDDYGDVSRTWSKCTNVPIVNIVKENYDFNTNIKKVQLESLGRINLKDKYIPNNNNGTYANPCISYGLKSLRRDELYRFAIVLYNGKGESSSALWIDDIRTPSINDSGFETFCANGQHYNDGGVLEDDNTELTVYPLGIQFEVDINSFNQKLKDDYPNDYEKYKITSYEIVRCHRSINDIQNIAQGVLARPICRNKHKDDHDTNIDNVYTPTGTLTTQQFWTGYKWIARSPAFDPHGDLVDSPEADNFDNHDLYQFICPEAVYNTDYIKQVVDNTQTYLNSVSYLFGHHANTNKLTYPQKMRNFDRPWVASAGQLGYSVNTSLKYDYIGSSVCGHNLALPPQVVDTTITSTGNPEFHDIIYKDLYGRMNNDRECALSTYRVYKYDDENSDKEKPISGLQSMFICQQYGRTNPSYYQVYPACLNEHRLDNYRGKQYVYRQVGRAPSFISYQTIGDVDNTCYVYGFGSADGLDNVYNYNQFGYTKLYEQSNIVFNRIYESLFGKTKYGDDTNYETIDLNKNKRSYKVQSCNVVSQIPWNGLFDSKTVDKTTTYSAKYTNNTVTIGNLQYCNVVDSGTFNNTRRVLSTDKSFGIFISDNKYHNRLDDSDGRSALMGTGGSCILLKLENINNIFYKNICTNVIQKPHTNTPTVQAVAFTDNDYKIPDIFTTGDFGVIPGSPKDGKAIYKSNLSVEQRHNSSYIDYIYDKDKTKINIYRSSISGTYLCNLRQKTTPYGGYDYSARCLNTYVSYGDVFAADQKVANVFDGDCYIQPFEYVSCHKYYDKNVGMSVTACLVYSIPVETSINLAYTSGIEFSAQTDGKASNIQEDPAQVNSIWAQEKPQYEYNSAYSIQPQIKTTESTDLSKDSNTLTSVDYRCYYSDKKTNNENSDSWCVFKPANFLDVDDRYGEITNLRTFNNQLFFWQEHAFGQFSVNERSQITDDSGKPLVLGTGGVLSRYDYLDTKTGMHREQYCDAQSSTALFWFDSHNNELKQLTSDGSVAMNKMFDTQNIMHERCGIKQPKLFYDKRYDELVSKVLLKNGEEQSLAFSSLLRAFTSVYTVNFEESITFDNDIYLMSCEDGKLVVNKWNTKNSTLYPNTIIKYVVNTSPTETKVFDNQEIITNDQLTKDYSYNDCIFKWSTNLNSEVQKSGSEIGITNREGNFRYSIPRYGNVEYGNRQRGKYMICEIDNLKNASISYIINKFRKSWI